MTLQDRNRSFCLKNSLEFTDLNKKQLKHCFLIYSAEIRRKLQQTIFLPTRLEIAFGEFVVTWRKNDKSDIYLIVLC